jgi:hypothetical protein
MTLTTVRLVRSTSFEIDERRSGEFRVRDDESPSTQRGPSSPCGGAATLDAVAPTSRRQTVTRAIGMVVRVMTMAALCIGTRASSL